MRTSIGSVGGAPSIGSFCRKSVMGGTVRQTASSRRPSTRMAPADTRMALARLPAAVSVRDASASCAPAGAPHTSINARNRGATTGRLPATDIGAKYAVRALCGADRDAELGFELRHEHIELAGDGADRVRLTEVDPRARQQIHRVIAPAGAQQREVPGDALPPLCFVGGPHVLHQARGGGEAGGVL